MALFGVPYWNHVGRTYGVALIDFDYNYGQLYTRFHLGGNANYTPLVGGRDAFIPAAFNAIVTHFSYDSSSALSANMSLRDRIFFYVFGEKPGVVVFKGVGLNAPYPCFIGIGVANGYDSTLQYYEFWRASSLKAPLTIYTSAINHALGGVNALGPNIFGYPVKYHYEIVDPATGMGGFAITLLTIPRIDPSVAIWW